MKKTALLSVSDKTNILLLAKVLIENNYSLLATGNTAKSLLSNGFTVTEVSTLTGFPEILDGRVKTLHPKIFAGILFKRENQEHIKQVKELQISSIDVVCVNLYPFEQVSQNPDAQLPELIENIDIGGPSLIRAAAKNYLNVSVLTSPGQYAEFITRIAENSVDSFYNQRLALEAFKHTAHYDQVISSTLSQRILGEVSKNAVEAKTLRYGENPHQKAVLEGNFFEFVEVLHGKELSYNNILDVVAAVQVTEEFDTPAAAIIKHNNPSGVALGQDHVEAFRKALECDPISAFGGIVAINGTVTADVAYLLNQIFLEVIVADGYEDGVLEILMKKKERRLIKKLKRFETELQEFKSVPGGIIRQDKDIPEKNLKFNKVTDSPGEVPFSELDFAWRVVKHIRSNAIVFTKNAMTIGIGAGQVSRIDSVKLAVMKAHNFGHDLNNTIVASDAFFPFADGIEECKKAGAIGVVQPGGSVRDKEVIQAANKLNILMYFTATRHFKH